MSIGFSTFFIFRKERQKTQKNNDAARKVCVELIRKYYEKPLRFFPERKAVESALAKIESESVNSRSEFDGIFSYFYENGRRNVNAAAMACWFSPTSIYRKLNSFCSAVEKELAEMKKYTVITVLRY